MKRRRADIVACSTCIQRLGLSRNHGHVLSRVGMRILSWQGGRLQSHPCTGVTSATRPSGPKITLNETCIGVMLTYTQLERQR